MSPVFILHSNKRTCISGREEGAIMVKVNGIELDIAGKTVSEYLAATSYDPKRIAVERNGDIIFKSQYDSAILENGDSLEIVSFVGGG